MGGSFHFQDRMAATPLLYFNSLRSEMEIVKVGSEPTREACYLSVAFTLCSQLRQCTVQAHHTHHQIVLGPYI